MSLWSSGMSHDWTGLLVPPLMFQTRLSTTACNKAVAYPFLASQYDLVNSSHCPRDGMCDGIVGPDDMMQVLLVHLMNQCMQLQHGSEECQGQRGPWLNHMSQPHLCSKLTRSTTVRSGGWWTVGKRWWVAFGRVECCDLFPPFRTRK